jgi:hypothetical protein
LELLFVENVSGHVGPLQFKDLLSLPRISDSSIVVMKQSINYFREISCKHFIPQQPHNF